MYYYTYLVIPTNKKSRLQGKIYFGKHCTNNINDGYVGSGNLIRRYIKKYPNDYYCEIIKFYSSYEELNEAEYDLIHPHLNKDYCLNLRDGGDGGKLSDVSTKKISKSKKGSKLTEEHKKNISLAQIGRIQSEETRRKIGEKNKISLKGHTPWNKDKKLSETHIKNLSESHKGQSPANKGKHLYIDPNGKKHYI